MINHHRGFIFVHIPKCGGTSIETVFNCWGNGYTEQYYHVGNASSDQHKTIFEILDAYPDCDNYFKFCFVRNPWAKFVSEYEYMLHETRIAKCPPGNPKRYLPLSTSFDDFCLNTNLLYKYSYTYHEKNQHEFIFDSVGNCSVDFIGKLENFQQDFDKICESININKTELPHEYKHHKRHYTEYYNDETRDFVARRFAKDIEYFGYEFEN